jgi:hypothetical protein
MKIRDEYSKIPDIFFPNVKLPGRTLQLMVHADVSGARLRDFAAYLTLVDRAYGRISPFGLWTYSRRPAEQLRVSQVRQGSIELIIEKILETSSQASPLIFLYLLFKYFPGIVKAASEGYRNYEDGRLSRAKRKEIEKRDTSSGQRLIKENDTRKSQSQTQIKKIVDDIISKESNLSNVNDEMREEITNILEEVTRYDRQLQQGAERFTVEYVKEIRIRIVPQSGGGIKTYGQQIETTKKKGKEEEKVEQYVLEE